MSQLCRDCGLEYEDDVSVCRCGALLKEVADCVKPKITLVSKADGSVIEIPEGGGLIGRACEISPDSFKDGRVSSIHCRITINDNTCFVEDIGTNGIGSTNGTSVNGIEAKFGRPLMIEDGCILAIASLSQKPLLFDVRITHPQTSVESANSHLETEKKATWVIKCRKCGKRHQVESIDSRIAECDNCTDIMHKKLIAKEKPIRVSAPK